MRPFAAVGIISLLLIIAIVALIVKSTVPMFKGELNSVSPQLGGGGVMRDSSMAYGTTAGSPGKAMMEGGYDEYARPMIAPAPMPPGGATPADRDRVGEKIIRNGSLTLRVDDAAKRLEELRVIVTNAKGFVASSNITDNANIKTAYATVRVPNDKFDDVRKAVKGLASTVFVESENSDDVTAQFVDLSARLTAAQAEEKQYLEILKRAGTIEDTLAVTQQLSQVRMVIEQLQGQMRYMNDQTSYATLTITLTEEAKVEAPTRVWKPGETFNLAMRGLVESLQELADLMITGAVFVVGLLLPIVLVFGLVLWIVWRIVKKISKR